MSQHESRITTNHNEIKKWIEARNGVPAAVKGTGSKDDPGLLRIDFEYNGRSDRLQELDWDSFFEKFDENNLAFLYQEKKKDGSQSTFFKFIDRESDQAKK